MTQFHITHAATGATLGWYVAADATEAVAKFEDDYGLDAGECGSICVQEVAA